MQRALIIQSLRCWSADEYHALIYYARYRLILTTTTTTIYKHNFLVILTWIAESYSYRYLYKPKEEKPIAAQHSEEL